MRRKRDRDPMSPSPCPKKLELPSLPTTPLPIPEREQDIHEIKETEEERRPYMRYNRHAHHNTQSMAHGSSDRATPRRNHWWSRLVPPPFRSRRKNLTGSSPLQASVYYKARDDFDQDLFVRSILESYASSSCSSTGSSKNPLSSATTFVDHAGEISVMIDELGTSVPSFVMGDNVSPQVADVDEVRVLESCNGQEQASRKKKKSKRPHPRLFAEQKQLEKDQHRARSRQKGIIFALCFAMSLIVLMVAACRVATWKVHRIDSAVRNESNITIASKTPSNSGSGSTDAREIGPNGIILPPIQFRDGLTKTPSSEQVKQQKEQEAKVKETTEIMEKKTAATYVHALLVTLSLWSSLVVIGLHVTFESFRTYSIPFVLELMVVQSGYCVTSLSLVLVRVDQMSDISSLFMGIAESTFNFGQISFACAIAFNMYRSVVSYADVLLDSNSARRRYRTYTVNVMVLSVLAGVILSLVSYRMTEGKSKAYFLPNFNLTCRSILYIYFPLMAFSFNFIFYLRFKRTIGDAYPQSATGRLNQVARSYMLVFFVCWGSVIAMTALQSQEELHKPSILSIVLQSIFDVQGIFTAVITLMNFYKCRQAFDFGLSLKAIDASSIEFEEPLKILGEGTFAVVLKAKWHQGILDNTLPTTVDVAVKTFKHTQFESLDQMKEEAYLASKLVHPCVMMTYGCYTIGNNLYIVSEFLGGGTLQDVIDANSSMPYDVILRYAHMIAMGMRFLHGLPVPIIHRDLKPLNCIFDVDQAMLKIADFGESKLFHKEEPVIRKGVVALYPSADLTLQMTTNIGSACWAAPEILKDDAKSEYSLKVDVYSFGIICWQLYTCQVPYEDIPGSVLAVAEAVLDGVRPPIPSDCPVLFAKIMRRCWHDDAIRRPNFEDIVQLLEMEMDQIKEKQGKLLV